MEPLKVQNVQAQRNSKFTFDPKGFFVIYLDKEAGEIVAEHYHNVSKEGARFEVATGKLNKVVRGRDALSIRDTILSLGLVSLQDHIGYLGYELGKAETALRLGLDYEQDDELKQSEND